MDRLKAFKESIKTGTIAISRSTAEKIVAYLEFENSYTETIDKICDGESENFDGGNLFADISHELIKRISDEIVNNSLCELDFKGI